METIRPVERPALSIIICTCDRAPSLLTAVQSVLAFAPHDDTVEVLVIDQSCTNETALALASLLTSDHRLHYQRERFSGLSRARNAGLRAARGELIAFTDDDCTVEPGWVAGICAAFAAHPQVGLVFGHVSPAPYDSTQGYLPGFEATEGMLTRQRMLAGAGYWGMGANLALRRTAVQCIGPFDVVLGAGTPLRSAEDVDYALRAARLGIAIYHTSQARVIHHGFRPWRESSPLMLGAALGAGAMYAKHLRAGGLFFTILWLNDLRGRIRDMLYKLLLRRRPLGAKALLALLRGFWRGWRLPLQSSQTPLCFRPYFALSAVTTPPVALHLRTLEMETAPERRELAIRE